MSTYQQNDIQEILNVCHMGRLALDLMHENTVMEQASDQVSTLVNNALILLDMLIEYPELLPPVKLSNNDETWYQVLAQTWDQFQVRNMETQEISDVNKFEIVHIQCSTV